MEKRALAAEARRAVEELHSYLSDQVAPLLVVEAAEYLIAQPPALGAEAIRLWVDGQLRAPGSSLSLADYLFHAVAKLELLGRLQLIDADPLRSYLVNLGEALAGLVPPEQRAALRAHLERASMADASLPATAQLLHRPATAAAPREAGASPDEPPLDAVATEALRRLSLLLARLPAVPAGAGPGETAAADLTPQLIIAAAEGARSQSELEAHLDRLRQAGVRAPTRLSGLFATLGRELPNWWVEAGEGAAFSSAPIQAMHRIVDLAADRATAINHFHELLRTAAEQFNEGSLPRALQVLEVARSLIAEGKVERARAELILQSAHQDLDRGRLMELTQQSSAYPQLRRLLELYPALTAEGLWRALDDEPDRSRRRLWLALLEVHGEAARACALDRLEESLARPDAGEHELWLRRNFVYFLWRAPAPETEDPGREIALVSRCAELGQLAPLVREAIIDLGLRRHPDAEAALRRLLDALERFLAEPASAPYPVPELLRMTSLVVTALARQGTASAHRSVVDHGLRRQVHLGDTLSRLAELGGQDLADEPELVGRLLEALRGTLPVRVLGLSLRRHDGPLHLVRALQGTRTEAIRLQLADLAHRFGSEPFGGAAAEVLASWDAPREPTPIATPAAPDEEEEAFAPAAPTPSRDPAVSLSGDLAAFGLPDLLQTFANARVSGRLVLRSPAGEQVAELLFREGLLRDARVGPLAMPDAFLQLMEVPEPGVFEFTRRAAELLPAGPASDVMGLLMEGMRRHDELQRARALVPDHAFLRPTGEKPTPPPEEQDGAFVRHLWTVVREGASAAQCAAAVPADAYRIRHTLAHWLTEGAVESVDLGPDPPP